MTAPAPATGRNPFRRLRDLADGLALRASAAMVTREGRAEIRDIREGRFTVPERHAEVISDALTSLWLDAPNRRPEIVAVLKDAGHSVWLEGDGDDDE